MMSVLLALAVVQAAATPAPPPPAPAQPHATMVVEPAAMLIATLDADSDGLATVDRDGKGVGYIVYSDWAERWLGDRNALPSPYQVDTTGDDRITADEVVAAMTRIFDRLDRDKDGSVSRAECLTIRASTGDDRDRDRDRPAKKKK